MALTDKLTAIADAIRDKTGKTDVLTLDRMSTEIAGIQGALPVCKIKVIPLLCNSCYLNHAQLPEIPENVEYPYLLVHQSETAVTLYTCKSKMFYEVTEDGTRQITIPDAAIRRKLNTAANVWVIDGVYTSSEFSVEGSGNWAVWWANYDVPKGSADAEEIYFPASQPQTEQPADATLYYYNGMKFPAIPADVATEEYPYRMIFKRTNGDIFFYGSTVQPFFEPEDKIRLKSGRRRCQYNPETSTWGEADTSTSSTYYAFSSWEILWSNCNIPNGSADATNIYYYGTPAVPDPLQGGI